MHSHYCLKRFLNLNFRKKVFLRMFDLLISCLYTNYSWYSENGQCIQCIHMHIFTLKWCKLKSLNMPHWVIAQLPVLNNNQGKDYLSEPLPWYAGTDPCLAHSRSRVRVPFPSKCAVHAFFLQPIPICFRRFFFTPSLPPPLQSWD